MSNLLIISFRVIFKMTIWSTIVLYEMIEYGHGIIGYILTLISLLNGVVACAVALIVLVLMIMNHRQNLKREEKFILMLSGHIYLFVCLNTIILISMNIQTLIGDIYGMNFDSSWCILRTYVALLTGFVVYHTFVLQVHKNSCMRISSDILSFLGTLSSLSYCLLELSMASILSSYNHQFPYHHCRRLYSIVSTSSLACDYLSTTRILLLCLIHKYSCNTLDCWDLFYNAFDLYIANLCSYYFISSSTIEQSSSDDQTTTTTRSRHYSTNFYQCWNIIRIGISRTSSCDNILY